MVRNSRMSKLAISLIGCIALLGLVFEAPDTVTAQERSANRLLTAKLVAVTSMPDGLDRWLVDDLRAWGRYRVTVDAEGADLVMRGYDPQKEPEYKMKRGIPQPKREKHEPPPVLSLTLIDWVSNQSLWQVDVLNKKPREGQSDPAPGPQTQIDARGLTPEQLAHKVAARLRQYVTELERNK
jgi:hypothetical protein